MKKILSIFLLIVLIISVCACAQTEKPAKEDETKNAAASSENAAPSSGNTAPSVPSEQNGDSSAASPSGASDSPASGPSDEPGPGHIHSFGAWTPAEEATCIQGAAKERACACGAKEKVYAKAPGHKLKNNVCTVCGAKASTGLTFETVSGKTYVKGIGTCKDTDLLIPDTASGKKVAGVSASAFSGNTKIVSVTFPEGIAEIGDSAFENCSSLRAVYLPEGLGQIGKQSFYFCYDLTDVTIPQTVKSIGKEAFCCCYKLVEVCNLSEVQISVKSKEGGHAGFYARSVITKGSNIYTTDGGYIFFDNGSETYLLSYTGNETALVLPETLNGKAYDLYRAAFYNRTKLCSVVVSEGTKKIGTVAFYGCSALKTVSFPVSIKTVDTGAFNFCTALKTVRYAGSKSAWFLVNVESDNDPVRNATFEYAG